MLSGQGVTVAVIDSGIGVNPDLKTSLGIDRVVMRWSAMTGSLTDEFGHGTHVAGIIGGNAKASSGPYATRTFRGVAPNVSFISMKVLGDDGSGEVSNVLRAVDWILQHKAQYHIRIVNLSLGHPVVESCAKDPLVPGGRIPERGGTRRRRVRRKLGHARLRLNHLAGDRSERDHRRRREGHEHLPARAMTTSRATRPADRPGPTIT